MERDRSPSRVDDEALPGGARAFRTIDSYKEATSFEPGFPRTCENMLLIGDAAEVRMGKDFIAVAVRLRSSDTPVMRFAHTLYSETATGNEDVVVTTTGTIIAWSDANK